jgi:hypothetical protein
MITTHPPEATRVSFWIQIAKQNRLIKNTSNNKICCVAQILNDFELPATRTPSLTGASSKTEKENNGEWPDLQLE